MTFGQNGKCFFLLMVNNKIVLFVPIMVEYSPHLTSGFIKIGRELRVIVEIN